MTGDTRYAELAGYGRGVMAYVALHLGHIHASLIGRNADEACKRQVREMLREVNRKRHYAEEVSNGLRASA